MSIPEIRHITHHAHANKCKQEKVRKELKALTERKKKFLDSNIGRPGTMGEENTTK